MYTYIQIKYKEKDDKRNIKCEFGQQTPTAWLINTCLLLPQFRANERGNDGAESGMPSQALGICELHQSCV